MMLQPKAEKGDTLLCAAVRPDTPLLECFLLEAAFSGHCICLPSVPSEISGVKPGAHGAK